MLCCADDVVDDFLADVSMAVGNCNAIEGAMNVTVTLQTDADNHRAQRLTGRPRSQVREGTE